MHTVYVTGSISPDAMALLERETNVILGYGPTAITLASVIDQVDGILVRTEILDAELIRTAPKLRVISRRGVGVDNVPLDVATQRGIPVFITAKANARTVAEHAFGLALAVSHRIVESDRHTRAGEFGMRDKLVGLDISGATLGVIGLGRIGREVARIGSQGFGMNVTGFDPYFTPDDLPGVSIARSLGELLERSQFVSVHIPLSPETRGYIGDAEFAGMRTGAILIQTSRGGIVDEAALVRALKSGRLGGAGVDVFESEPPAADHPLFAFDNVVVTPHTSGLTAESIERMSMASVEGILDVFSGTSVDDLLLREDWKVFNPGFAEHVAERAETVGGA